MKYNCLSICHLKITKDTLPQTDATLCQGDKLQRSRVLLNSYSSPAITVS